MARLRAERVELGCRNCGRVIQRLASLVRYQRMSGHKEAFCSRRCVYEFKTRDARKRASIIRSLRKQGYTFREIGEEWGVSRQRVHQVLKKGEGAEKRLGEWRP